MTEPQRTELLQTAGLEVEGSLQDASNVTVRVRLLDQDGKPTAHRALYKPIRGEAPLADFPDGTLALREVAAYSVSTLGGWDLVPETVLRDGPLGPGSLQWWIDWEATDRGPGEWLLEVFRPGAVPQGWLPVVAGEDGAGQQLVVAHAGVEPLRSLAVLDLVLNNADRKGAHLLRDGSGRLWAVDHGLTLHAQDKLRTVLWGFAGEPIAEDDLERLRRLRAALESDHALADLLSDAEVEALARRVRALLQDPVLPALPPDRYPLPWPLW